MQDFITHPGFKTVFWGLYLLVSLVIISLVFLKGWLPKNAPVWLHGRWVRKEEVWKESARFTLAPAILLGLAAAGIGGAYYFFPQWTAYLGGFGPGTFSLCLGILLIFRQRHLHRLFDEEGRRKG